MPLFGPSKAARSHPKTEAEVRPSLAHALVSLEKRYVFDAALASELTDLASSKTVDVDDTSTHHALGASLLEAALPVSTAPVETHVDTTAVDTSALEASGHAVYFIDGNVEQKDVLIAGLPAGADIVILDTARDGVAQIADAMALRSGVDQVHIFAHGSEGTLSLGSTVLDAATMNGLYGSTLAGIGSHLTEDADILVYGCDFAEGTDGQLAVDLLASLTGADVAASTDLTGASARGGDWTLEYATGSIEAQSLAFEGFDATLEVAAISATGAPSTNGLHSVGASATWSNVSTVGGQPVDIRATVIAADAGATITFGTTGDDLRMELENGTATVQWELFLAGTSTAVSADINFQITDLDGPNIEYVSASTGYTVDAATHLSISNAGPVVTAAGTQNQNSEPASMIRFSWTGVSSMTVDYTATSGNDIRIFNHDGDLDLAFANPVTVAPPALDLDTGTAGVNYATTFTENGAAVSVTDPTVDITNSTNVTGATITLTNAQTADTLSLGSLPGGISGSVDTSVPGQITVTLSGTATAAAYETALHGITFSNSSDTPNTTQRIVQFQLQNTIYSSTTSTTTINVVPVNDGPVANDDAFSTTVGTPVAGSVTGNDSDPEGDTLTYTLTTGPSHGSVTVNANGSFNYTPTGGWAGTDTFTYTANDGNGGTDTAVVTIVVQGPPVAVDDTFSTPYATPLSGSVAGNDSDPNGDTLTYTLGTGPSHGSVAVNANGTFSYTPTGGYSGTDSFTYSVSDGHGGTATATATITIGNGAPVAVDDTFSTAYATPLSGTVATNDSDPNGDTLTYTLGTGPSHGSVTLNANGSFSYTPTGGYSGADSFTYSISDGHGGTASATATITIGNAPPVAGNDSFTTAYATPLSGTVATNDSDPNGDTLTYALATGPSHGSVTVNANGSFSYTPTGGYSGADSFTYTVNDGNGGTATATASITIGNGGPIAVDDTFSTGFGTPLSGTVATNDSDPNGDTLTYALATGPSHGSVTVNANGSFSYTPTGGYSGADSFTYTVNDGNGGTATATASITVGNAPPVAVADSFTTAYGTPLSGTVATNDSDPNGDTLTFALATGPSHGSVTVNANGSFSYTPTGGYSGADSFTYTVDDGHGGTASATASITIANAPPVAGNDTFSTGFGTPLSATVATNDSDPNGDTLTYALATGPSHGSVTLNADGTFSYTPAGGYSGADSFTYTVNDGHGGTATATASITIANAPPVAGNDTFSTAYTTWLNASVAGNDSDPNGDPLTYALVTGPSHGFFTLNANGTFDYTPYSNFSGTDGFTYTVDDGHGGTATATATITVGNGAPVAQSDAFTTAYATALNGTVAGNDSDPNGDPLTYTLVTAPPNGSLTLNADGTFAYTPAGGYSGTETFTYSINDGHGGTSSAIATITVNARPNAAPIAVDDSAATSGGTAVTGTVASNDSDPDGDALTWTLNSGAAHGTVSVAADGRFTYTPTTGFVGSDTFTYRVTDTQGASATATVTVTVADRAPTTVSTVPTQNGIDLTAVSVNVAGYFTDPDGDTLGYTATGLPPGLSIDANTGAITGTLSNGASGATGTSDYAVRVTATDPHGATVTQTFTWRVTNVAPVAVADNFSTTGTTAVAGSVATNDTDADGDALTFRLTGQTAHGTVVFNPDGSFSYTAQTLFSGVDTFTYSVTDANGGTSTATASIRVAAPTVLPTSLRCITTFGNLSQLRALLRALG